VSLSRRGRKPKTVHKPEAGRTKGRTYPRRHWWVVSADAASSHARNCGHRHSLVSEAFACLAERPGQRVFLVTAEEEP
jgi:hypothetical protein